MIPKRKKQCNMKVSGNKVLMQFLDIHACNDSTSFLDIICSDTSNNDCAQSYSIEADFNYSLSTKTAHTLNMNAASTNAITKQLINASSHDKNYQELIHQIKEGFQRLEIVPILYYNHFGKYDIALPHVITYLWMIRLFIPTS